MGLLDLTSSCKQWIVEKATAQDSTALNLCSLFDRESRDTASGEQTLHSCVTLPMARLSNRKMKKGDTAKEAEKGSKKKKDDVNGQARMRKKTQSTEKKKGKGDSGGGGKKVLGGKRASLPAKSIATDTASESEEESSSDEEEEVHGEVHHDVSVDSKEEECEEKEDEKGSESPEKTLDELMANGWDWRAEDRVKATPTSTDELKEPGSLLKHLCISSVPVNRVVKQRIEELEDAEAELGNVIKENTDLKRKVSELEGQFEVLRMMKKAKKGEEMSPEQRQMIADVSAEIRKHFVRVVKFPRKVGWQYWSEDPNSASGMIASKINWPSGCTVEHKEAIWNTFLAKVVPRMVTAQRNKITQEMRRVFWRECCLQLHLLHAYESNW